MQVVASVLPAFDGLARQRVVSRSNVATHSSSRVCGTCWGVNKYQEEVYETATTTRMHTTLMHPPTATGMVIEARQMTAREMRERRHLRIRKKVWCLGGWSN